MDASAGCMVGYTFDHGISLEAGYHFGLGDLMVTKTNNYRWIDPTNWVQSVYFKLGYAIGALGEWHFVQPVVHLSLAAVSRSSHRSNHFQFGYRIQVP